MEEMGLTKNAPILPKLERINMVPKNLLIPGETLLYHGTNSKILYELSNNKVPRGPAWFTLNPKDAKIYQTMYHRQDIYSMGRTLIYRVIRTPKMFDNSNEVVNIQSLNRMRVAEGKGPLPLVLSGRGSVIDRFGSQYVADIVNFFKNEGYDGIYDTPDSIELFDPARFIEYFGVMDESTCYDLITKAIKQINETGVIEKELRFPIYQYCGIRPNAEEITKLINP